MNVWDVMYKDSANVLLVAMPFAGTAIPSIQLPLLAGYLTEQNIPVHEEHLYLKAAEIFGIPPYNILISPPNDSYTAQMVFSKYVFPDHWQKNKEKFEAYFQKKTKHLCNTPFSFTFDEYVDRTDSFFTWVLKHVDWQTYDLIGFTLNYGQFLPSLAIAKHLKKMYPEKRIVFGGSRTTGKLGKRVLETFDYVDFIVSGEGEEALFQLAHDPEHGKVIPNLIYRSGDSVVLDPAARCIDLNNLPVPSYDRFFEQLQSTSAEVQQYFQYCGRLPVEISRGCWWNRCSFCNLNIQYASYTEKNVENIVEEIRWLSDRYKMLSFQLIGNTLPKQHYRLLCERLIDLEKDFSLFVEARAGRLTQDDYQLLKQAGFTSIQTGIESFSSHYLKTMNKGVRVIDNIAALKFCKENGIQNAYNLIVNYPNEEPIDFEETKQTVHLIQSFLDPPQYCELRVLYGSPIHQNPWEFNIEHFESFPIDQLMFPPEYLEKQFNFVYAFKQKHKSDTHPWRDLVEQWQTLRTQLLVNGLKNQMPIDQYIFYFVDGGTFIKIYDKRECNAIQIYTLNTDERDVFLSCCDVISFEKLQDKLPHMPDYQLAAILHSFEKNGIVFREDDSYLSLPLCYSLVMNQHSKKEQQSLLYTSGMQRSL